MNKLKSNKGATSTEIIVYACIVMIMFTMGFVLKEPVKELTMSISPNVVSNVYEEYGKVKEKHIVSGYRGAVYYLTAVEIKDKSVVELNDKDLFYSVSEGDEISLEKTVFKNKKTGKILKTEYEIKE